MSQKNEVWNGPMLVKTDLSSSTRDEKGNLKTKGEQVNVKEVLDLNTFVKLGRAWSLVH